MGIKMKTTILCLMSVSLLTPAGCAAEQTDVPSPPAAANNLAVSPARTQPPVSGHESPPEPPFTLAQCIEIALQNNPDIVGGGFDVSAAKAEKNVAAGQRWPQIGLEGYYRHNTDDQRLIQPRYNGEPGVFSDDILGGNIVLRMPIFTSGRIENQIRAADLLSQSETRRLARTRQQLVFNVSQVFYNILAQRHIVESLDFSKKVLEEHHKRVNDLIAVQRAAKVDLLRTEVRLADIEQRLVAEDNIMSILRRVLVNFLGTSSPQSKIDIIGDLELTAVNANLSESLGLAMSQRADYLAIQKRVQAQGKNLSVAKAGHWPIVSAEASYGVRSADNPSSHPAGTNNIEDVGFIGISAAWPIFEGGTIEARIRREYSKLSSLRQQLRKLELQINLDVETAVLNITASQKRVQATEKSIEQAKESLRIEREKYDLGKGSITDVLDAQSALLDAQTTYYHALSDYNSAVAQWYLAIGDAK
ncbi:MAG: hypothetical protein B6I25_07305 [Planctomycetales bacterium 4572_13]|nr:MAG: hypothetical protein B6I25_07305 [Planctomycetales bacterium 4572_13]